jgi:hypothetical protein
MEMVGKWNINCLNFLISQQILIRAITPGQVELFCPVPGFSG